MNRHIAIVAGTVAIASMLVLQAQSAGPSSPPAAASQTKFDIPVWHPDARWEREQEPWAACGAGGNLDGPRQQIMWRRGYSPWGTYQVYEQGGWPINFAAYDARNERIHVVAGSSRGYMDGPFSRARWAGQSYSNYGSSVLSDDGRYYIATDPNNGGAVRVLDLKEQMIRTLLPPKSGAQAMVLNSKGQAMVLLGKGRLVTLDVQTGNAVADVTLKADKGLSLGFGRGLALDEKKNRLYACGTHLSAGDWHLWYFDLNDGGSFNGVLKGKRVGAGPPAYTGPFDGFWGYPEHAIHWGPDDPDKRFLYMKVTDTGTFLRIDLEKRMVGACSGPPRGKTGPIMFIESGTPNGTTPHCGPGWLSDGSIIMPGLREGPSYVYKRVK